MVGEGPGYPATLPVTGEIMNSKTSTEQHPEEIDHHRCHEIAAHCVTAEEDHRPMITCECGLWGEPCPHFFWAPIDAPPVLLERPI